jgi:hypothetical protein
MEYLLIGSGIYTSLSFHDYYKKILNFKRYNKHNNINLETIDDNLEAIELYQVTENISMPFYINAGSSMGLSIPIGGGEKSNSFEFLINRTVSRNNSKMRLTNFDIIDKPNNQFFINDHFQLKTNLTGYDIETQQIMYRLPLKANQYKLNKNVYKIHSGNIGIIGTNKNDVINKFCIKSRLPLSFTCGALTLFSVIYIINK